MTGEFARPISELTDDELRYERIRARATEIAGDHPCPRFLTSREILETDWPEPDWVVDGLLPAGLSLLTGGPKLGKSFMVLDLAAAIAEGGAFLGQYSTTRGKVVYIAAEDVERRLKDRLISLRATGNENLLITTKSPKGLSATIGAIMREHPDTVLIIVDTFQRCRVPSGQAGETLYQAEYREVSEIASTAGAVEVSVALVHHTNKRNVTGGDSYDLISGSNGIAAVVDTNMILTRSRGQRDAVLRVDGRDVEPQEIALAFEPEIGTWAALGDAAEVQVTGERQDIYDLLKEAGEPLSPKQVATELDKNVNTTSNLLRKMYGDGVLARPKWGVYTVASVASVANCEPEHEELATVTTLATGSTMASEPESTGSEGDNGGNNEIF